MFILIVLEVQKRIQMFQLNSHLYFQSGNLQNGVVFSYPEVVCYQIGRRFQSVKDQKVQIQPMGETRFVLVLLPNLLEETSEGLVGEGAKLGGTGGEVVVVQQLLIVQTWVWVHGQGMLEEAMILAMELLLVQDGKELVLGESEADQQLVLVKKQLVAQEMLRPVVEW